MAIDNEQGSVLGEGVHPIERDQYTLATKPIGEVLNTIRRWRMRKLRGGIISGRPRLGKSRAVRFLMNHIKDIFGKEIAHFRFDCATSVSKNEGGFWTDFLRDIGYGLPDAGHVHDKRHRAAEFIISEAQRMGDHRAVLFIDEAQNLRWMHYDWLIALYNELEENDIQLYVYLFGQEELKAQKEAFRAEGRLQVVGRFMVQQISFRGLGSKEDLRYALSRYDDHSEYPTGSGISFTRHYFPAAFERGWRLADQTDLIWGGFMEIRTQSNIHGKPNIPMQAFTAVVDGILLTCGSKSSTAPTIAPKTVMQLIQESGYTDLEQSAAA